MQAIAQALDAAMTPGGPGLIWAGVAHRYDVDGEPIAELVADRQLAAAPVFAPTVIDSEGTQR